MAKKTETPETAPEQKQASPMQVVETAINKAFKSGVFDMNEGAMVLNAMAALHKQVTPMGVMKPV